MCRVISSCPVPGSGVIRATSFCLLESKSQIEEVVCSIGWFAYQFFNHFSLLLVLQIALYGN